MIGVKFTRAMSPFSAGSTALLPEDVARRILAEGAAEAYRFAASPHAVGASEPAPQKQDQSGKYRTKSK